MDDDAEDSDYINSSGDESDEDISLHDENDKEMLHEASDLNIFKGPFHLSFYFLCLFPLCFGTFGVLLRRVLFLLLNVISYLWL